MSAYFINKTGPRPSQIWLLTESGERRPIILENQTEAFKSEMSACDGADQTKR